MPSKAQQRRIIKSDVLVVGVDVGKHRQVAIMRRPDGTKSKPFSFSNARLDFQELLGRAESEKKRQGCRSFLFALEATGHYSHALRHYLAERGYDLVGINPAHTKKAKELEDNSPEKSDPKDAGVIADLAAQGRGRPIMIPRGAFADLRRLGKLRARLVTERVRLCNRYHGLVDLLFPELAGIVRDVACRSLLRLMAEFPTPAEIAALDQGELESRLWRWSRGHIQRSRIGRIHRVARESVGLKEGLSVARLELRQVLESLELVEQRRTEVERSQKAALKRVPYAELLLSVPHLGPVALATILGETGDLRLYPNAKALIKYAGYNLYTIASGSFRGRTRITKRGRPLLRHQLYLAAMRISRQGAPLEAFRLRLAGSKPGPAIFVGGCRKLVRLLFALVRDGKRFEPGRFAVEPSRNIAA